MPKTRLDRLLVSRGLCESREQARRLIMAGEVLVNDRPLTKPGMQVQENADIRVRQPLPYVSRGGFKLAAALDAFGIEPQGWVCADVGASTGGFTDVLLQRGAQRVYAIDVGYGQLHWKLRQDPRVVVMERTNARNLLSLPEPVQLVTLDASFISLRLLLQPARAWLDAGGQMIALVKPQFEAGREHVGKGGVVRDPGVHRRVLQDLLAWCRTENLGPQGLIASPIKGPKGNREFLLWLRPGSRPRADDSLLRTALQENRPQR
ncbi:MAG: TlyA family RNA methyltransferase [Caldilineae bacterium]|nr:MAG: TlyA family RNA methyltransferase [Caldilineae bacterium]